MHPQHQETSPQPSKPQPHSSDTGTNNRRSAIVETLEHRRFTEFCDACKRYRYIGLCYGAPGVGKTLSALHYANWARVQAYWNHPCQTKALLKEITKGTVVFFTSPVVSSPGHLERDIRKTRSLLHNAAIERARRYEHARMKRLLYRAEKLRDPQRNPDGYRSDEAFKMENAFHEQRDRAIRVASTLPDPTALLVIDEADRLKVAGLEQVRDIFDQGRIGLVLIGMPGIEKRLARYPQFYSRIGFVHEFRPLDAAAIRQLLDQGWTPSGVHLPPPPWDQEAVAAIIRMTGGNFRLLNRLLTQMERILEINALREMSKAVVEAARESLVIGQA
ncbi:MAG: AAA family ATPase [Acidobacteria bacterium]|nr:AAA family ATPase [Acidobacteriota bacterium]MBI3656542.1 AAA family ATPase [Acidobacteriota bacterium]